MLQREFEAGTKNDLCLCLAASYMASSHPWDVHLSSLVETGQGVLRFSVSMQPHSFLCNLQRLRTEVYDNKPS